jgi:phage baseplate assembly protein V
VNTTAVVQEIGRRVAMALSRCVLSLVNDKAKMQLVQVRLLADEVKDDVEHFQLYGFTSVPFDGAEGVALFLGGGRDHGIVLCLDDRRYRLTQLQQGEVALYTDEGTKLILKRNRIVELDCDTFKVTCKDYSVGTETLELNASSSITVKSPSVDVNP